MSSVGYNKFELRNHNNLHDKLTVEFLQIGDEAVEWRGLPDHLRDLLHQMYDIQEQKSHPLVCLRQAIENLKEQVMQGSFYAGPGGRGAVDNGDSVLSFSRNSLQAEHVISREIISAAAIKQENPALHYKIINQISRGG